MEYRQVIRNHYAGMADAHLQELWQERHGLTSEALEALKEEMLSRDIFQREGLVAEADLDLLTKNPADRLSRKEMKTYWNELLELAQKGETPEWLAFRLKQKGLSDDEATFMVNGLVPAISNKINEADSERLGAFIRLCCGVAIIIIAMLARLGNGMYFIGLLAIALSIVQAAIADSKKSRYKQLHSRLTTVSEENDSADGSS